jgi:two-component system response regulator RegX3
MLITRPGRTVPKEALARRLWGPDYDFTSRRLEVNVSRLRSKLPAGNRDGGTIVTERGVGYRYQASALTQLRLTQ